MANPKNYINNRTLYDVIIKYKSELRISPTHGVSHPNIPNYRGEAFDKRCKRLATKVNFSGYSPQWKQEMISDGLVDCIAAIDNFEPEKSNNPFAYFTMIAWNAFVRRIKKEKKEVYVKHKNFENNILTDSGWSDAENIHLKSNEYSNELIKDFEEKLTKEQNCAKMKASKLKQDISYDFKEVSKRKIGKHKGIKHE